MNSITVSAPGKLHLISEHSVVYGAPALLSAVNKRCYVTLQVKTQGSRLKIQDLNKVKKYIDLCLKEALNYFGKIEYLKSLILNLKSDIPLGSGMGSSAAIAVAVAGAVSQLIEGQIDKEKVNEITFACEKHMHGNPSGGDNATCTYGGIIWYQKKENGEKIIKPITLSLSPNITNKFFIINTGKPDESTKEMVSMVRNKMNDSSFKNIIEEQEKLTQLLLARLKKEDTQATSQIMIQSEKNLERMGVVSASTQQLIRAIEKIGFAAKVSGAGGLANSSGIVLAFGDNFANLQQVAKEFGLSCEQVILGEEGVRLE